jgi:hypothetical protein
MSLETVSAAAAVTAFATAVLLRSSVRGAAEDAVLFF